MLPSSLLSTPLSALTGRAAAGQLIGAVLAVGTTGGELIEAVGRSAPDGPALRPDAVVRISSMTKPLVAALTHQLAGAGLLSLEAPVTDWLPELADRRVLRRLDGPVDDTVPAERPVTVEDLLLMRLGFGFAFEVGSCPVADLAVAAGLGMGPPLPAAVPHPPDEWLRRFAELPLMDQPGQVWRYDLAYAVLGILLARAAGRPLPELLADRLLAPLGMVDTGFVVPAGARDRLVPCFTDGTTVLDGVQDSQWLEPPVFPHAGGGLVSTAADCLRFGRLLLDDGMVAGERLLPEGAVAAMTTNHLTAAQADGPSARVFLDGEGWGHGVQIRSDPALPRRYGWGGGLGTLWYNFPDHQVTAVLLTQHLPPQEGPSGDFLRALDQRLGA